MLPAETTAFILVGAIRERPTEAFEARLRRYREFFVDALSGGSIGTSNNFALLKALWGAEADALRDTSRTIHRALSPVTLRLTASDEPHDAWINTSARIANCLWASAQYRKGHDMQAKIARWWGALQIAHDMVSQHEMAHNISYDRVMMTRCDIEFHAPSTLPLSSISTTDHLHTWYTASNPPDALWVMPRRVAERALQTASIAARCSDGFQLQPRSRNYLFSWFIPCFWTRELWAEGVRLRALGRYHINATVQLHGEKQASISDLGAAPNTCSVTHDSPGELPSVQGYGLCSPWAARAPSLLHGLTLPPPPSPLPPPPRAAAKDGIVGIEASQVEYSGYEAPSTDPWPPPNPIMVRQLYAEAGFDRTRFFHLLGERSNWTAASYLDSGIHVTTRGCRRPICTLGDSICGEVKSRLQRLLTPAHCLGRLQVATIGQLVSNTYEPFATRRHPLGRDCGAFVLCGLSLHRLVRSVPSTAKKSGDRPMTLTDPVADHAAFFDALLRNLSALSNSSASARRPVILVGSGEIDALTLLSRPAKHDWQDFHQFGLLGLWHGAEREVLRQARQGGWLAPHITYLDTHELYARYPGVRCDGMHFMSDFASFSEPRLNVGRDEQGVREKGPPSHEPRTQHDCYSSAAVWDWYLLRALQAAGLYERVSLNHWRESV